MNDPEMNTVKTDIALIKRDISQIEKVFKKVDDAIGQMSEILKTIAVQETILESNDKRLSIIEQQIIAHIENESKARKELEEDIESIKEDARSDRDKRHTELMNYLNEMNKNIGDKIETQDKRIQKLENWRWYIIGASGVIIFLITIVPWGKLIG